MEKIKIGIIGFGTVGSAVDKLIRQNGSLIADRIGVEFEISAVADVSKKIKHPKLVRDAYQIINDPGVLIIVEAIGGVNPALEYILSAIKAGKHIVTSNKEVIALHGDKIFKEAEKNKCMVRFEGAVGGGIPIIGPLSSDLLANDLTEVFGIVNGTTNYILSKMATDGLEFGQALKEAQELGFAEARPQKDIEGYDASYKAAILASVAFGAKIDWKSIYFEGIGKITQEDIRYADEIGYAVKLLAIAKKSADSMEVRVHPTLIPKDHPLASVSGAMNAIYVKGNMVGELMFYGPGAGGAPTASAIVGDIIAIVNPKFEMLKTNLKALNVKPIDEILSRYYIRLTAPDRHGVLAGISKVFADENVSIAAVMQKETVGKTATIVIILHEAKEENLRKAVAKLKRLSVVKEVSNVIRVGL